MTQEKSKNAIVMVHPFDSQGYEDQADYVMEREKILTGEREEDLFVLTSKVGKTRKELGILDAAVISTGECNPKPLMGWREFSRLLKDYEDVMFCGAELYLDHGRPDNGCVLGAFKKTQVKNKWIYLAGCWAEHRRYPLDINKGMKN